MISASRFAQLQGIFYRKVTSCCNPSEVTLKFIKVNSTGRYTDFTGDSDREAEQSYTLKCFYMRALNDKQRENVGVTQEVTDIVYISPIELEQKYGSKVFPERVMNSYAEMVAEFLGKHYEIMNIQALEPMFNGKEYICLCYQLNLRNTLGNRSFM